MAIFFSASAFTITHNWTNGAPPVSLNQTETDRNWFFISYYYAGNFTLISAYTAYPNGTSFEYWKRGDGKWSYTGSGNVQILSNTEYMYLCGNRFDTFGTVHVDVADLTNKRLYVSQIPYSYANQGYIIAIPITATRLETWVWSGTTSIMPVPAELIKTDIIDIANLEYVNDNANWGTPKDYTGQSLDANFFTNGFQFIMACFAVFPPEVNQLITILITGLAGVFVIKLVF